MRRLLLTITCLTAIFGLIYSGELPKREMRAAWMATAVRDFPVQNYSNGQQMEIRSDFNKLKAAGFNTVIFQVRPGCDAFYESSYEPWSHLLMGASGLAPDAPYYDPLAYMVQEAHARGMEVHAWFNPFRLSTISNLENLHETHVYKEHPEWKMNHDTKMLNPGIPEVRDYTVDVLMDVVNRYDIDGVHMDDYFYPYAGMSNEDAAEFAADPRGIANIDDWRRDNINSFVEALYDSIKSQKPWVKLGISPFGIWKSGTPTGINGLSSYSAIYCDPMAWLAGGYIDYVNPQLYWPFGGGQNFGILMPWWADQVNLAGRHLYVGHAAYRITTPTSGWSNGWNANEVPRQIRALRADGDVQGSVYFRLLRGLFDNPKGFQDSLKQDLYRHPALIPAMPWLDDVPPNQPAQMTWEQNGDSKTLSWMAPSAAADGDTASQYVIYRSETTPVDVDLAANIVDVIPASRRRYTDNTVGDFYYTVTALDRVKNESLPHPTVSLDEIAAVPDEFILYPNYPNPFNPSTTISFSIGEGQDVRLSVYDISGQHVLDLHEGYLSAGKHAYGFDSRMGDGYLLPTGVYLARLETRNGSQVQRMLLLK
ncbi:MAG: family 10 glycosylhydrolase [Candidatus Marinimicrobia bacterium]|nr:family 10 glycosylhydrolase [Candidatus Neomarinimicrobiota bacterium]MCF7851074.1 family 10 glycosylhydrolase [Candidatus Neomarinimicrobiota bacterium]